MFKCNINVKLCVHQETKTIACTFSGSIYQGERYMNGLKAIDANPQNIMLGTKTMKELKVVFKHWQQSRDIT